MHLQHKIRPVRKQQDIQTEDADTSKKNKSNQRIQENFHISLETTSKSPSIVKMLF